MPNLLPLTPKDPNNMTGRFKPTIGIEWAEPVKRDENQVFSHDDFMVMDIEQ
jgi:hypothetical protein